MRPQLLHCCLLVVLWSLNAVAGSGSTQSTDLVFIYVHGFGGEKKSPQYSPVSRGLPGAIYPGTVTHPFPPHGVARNTSPGA